MASRLDATLLRAAAGAVAPVVGSRNGAVTRRCEAKASRTNLHDDTSVMRVEREVATATTAAAPTAAAPSQASDEANAAH